jgi:hypothetical protein
MLNLEILTAVTIKNLIFWKMTPFMWYKFTDVTGTLQHVLSLR